MTGADPLYYNMSVHFVNQLRSGARHAATSPLLDSDRVGLADRAHLLARDGRRAAPAYALEDFASGGFA
jgi:hypothetical protein